MWIVLVFTLGVSAHAEGPANAQAERPRSEQVERAVKKTLELQNLKPSAPAKRGGSELRAIATPLPSPTPRYEKESAHFAEQLRSEEERGRLERLRRSR